jgi:hypothetical protein
LMDTNAIITQWLRVRTVSLSVTIYVTIVPDQGV